MTPTRSILLFLTLAACATSPSGVGHARFANKPIVWKVDDRGDVKKKPEYWPFAQKIYFFDAYVYTPLAHSLAVPVPRHALDVNAVDEVPDSTWFENRLGRRELTVDEVRTGPNKVEADATTWNIIQSKTVGGSAGFIALDGRGDRYVLKLDEPHAPVTESATDVAVQRLMWAIGYHVPENSIVYLKKEQLHRDPKAVVKDEFGNERPMTDRDIDATLARGYLKRDGTYRMLASKYLSGKPLGGFMQRGVREDDPNDQIPHEHRRVVRALYLFYAWLQQTDVKEDNTLDMWVEDKKTGKHWVKHHLLDFGKSLGMSAWIVPRPGDGHQQNVDYPYTIAGILSFGLWKRPYEGTLTPGIQGVGTFDAEHYDPAKWEPHANYVPLYFMDHRDLFWAGKIMVRFTPEMIRAALEQGRYEDPRAVDYLVDVLVARQRITARWALSRVSSIDRFVMEERSAGTAPNDRSSELCFDDLLVVHNLVPGAKSTTRFFATAWDYAGNRIPWTAEAKPAADHGACFAQLPRGRDHDDYTIIRIIAERATKPLNPVEVHLARDPANGRLRIVGIHRQ